MRFRVPIIVLSVLTTGVSFEPTPELIAGIWNELGDAIKDAPIIPFHTLAKKRMIYSMFDDIATQKESEERFYPAFRTQNV